MIFEQIMALPESEKAELLARLAREKELMEELQDIATFDERIKEPGGISLADTQSSSWQLATAARFIVKSRPA